MATGRHLQQTFVAAIRREGDGVRAFRFLPSPRSVLVVMAGRGGAPRLFVCTPASSGPRMLTVRSSGAGADAPGTEGARLDLDRRIAAWEAVTGLAGLPDDFFAPSASRNVAPGIAAASEPELVNSATFAHPPDRLYHLQIGVTYACQCRCAHCGVADQRNRGRLLSKEEIVDLCRQARQDLGASVVELFGGEPLVRRDIREIVEGCGRHLDVWMSSNGLGFTPELARELKDRGLSRCFLSLDSSDPERHDRNRNTPGGFEAVMRAVDHCADAGIDVNFSTCAMASIVVSNELEDLIELTRRSRAGKLRLVLPKMVGRMHLDESVLLTRREMERIREITAREEIAYVEAEGNFDGRVEKCFCLRGHVYVNPFGIVQPCVYTSLDFGNVREQPLSEIYARLHRHAMFADKSVLNLCLMQNPWFVRSYLPDVSPGRPVPPAADGTDLLPRRPEPEAVMEGDERVRPYAEWGLTEPFEEFVAHFRKALPDVAVSGRVLDLGCGQAEVSIPFARAFPACTIDAVDASAAMLDGAGRRIGQAGLGGRIGLFRRRLPADGPPADGYHGIIANSFLHHLDDPSDLWRTVARHAAPGAFIFVMDLRRPAIEAEVHRLVAWYARDLAPAVAEDFRNSLFAAYRPAEVADQLAAAGLACLAVEPVGELFLAVYGRLPGGGR